MAAAEPAKPGNVKEELACPASASETPGGGTSVPEQIVQLYAKKVEEFTHIGEYLKRTWNGNLDNFLLVPNTYILALDCRLSVHLQAR